MPESRVRVLVINPKLNQAVGIKNALEALGGFEARPFTSSINALEFARNAPPDIAVLDIAIRSPNISETTVALRKLNSKVKLLLTNAPDEAVTKLRADGVVTLPARAREVEPLLRRLFPAPASDNRPPTPVRRPEDMFKPKPNEPPETPANDPSQPDPFARIAAEEPPVPTAAEGGTVREAVRALLPRAPLDESMYVVEITPRQSDTDEGQPAVVADDEPKPAPVEAVAEPAAPEPAEEPAAAPPPQPEPAIDIAAEPAPSGPETKLGDTTRPRKPAPEPVGLGRVHPIFDDSDADLEGPALAVRRPIPAPPPVVPPPAPPPVVPAVVPAVADDAQPAASAKPEAPAVPATPAAPEIKIPGQRRPVKKKTDSDARTLEVTKAAETGPAALNPADLQRALILTHQQIGTTAAALILTQGDEVLAHSGEMPTQEIEELQSVIGGDWDVRGSQARIRYITLPTSRQEYMLHTRRTDNGYALSMAFAGDLPVRDIRAQSDAVAATLEQMRVSDNEPEDSEPEITTVRLPFTAVWMLEHPEDPLTSELAQAVVLEFDTRLRELGWPIHTMNVHADFVYVFCDVQTTYLASEVVAELKRISAEAVCTLRSDWSPETLWADAYMALVPGRELGSDEVQSFLNFTRSRLRRKVE